MKKIVSIVILYIPFFVFAQSPEYSVNSFLNKGKKAPNTHHIGNAWLNFLVQGNDDFKYNITQATFSSNSTLD